MKDASLVSQKKEAVHKAKIADWEKYDVAESEANCFIVCVVAYVWISPLSKGSSTFYEKRKTKELLDQLQVVCRGHHIIELLALQDEMWTMHVSTDTIPQYIAAFLPTRQIGRASCRQEFAFLPTRQIGRA